MASRPSRGEPPGLVVRGDAADGDRARMLGTLTFTPMSVSLDDVPAREAFNAISQALGITIVGRWSDDRTGQGIDPTIPLVMHVERASARQVIEELLEQCEMTEDCTWQLRAGMVEIGTKRRLAVPAARERVSYDLTDLLLEPPYFIGPKGGGSFQRMDSPYVDAVLGQESRDALREGKPLPRKTKPMIIRELVEGLSETIDPGRWDVASILNTDDATQEPDPAAGDANATRRNTSAWASARVFRDSLVITAPDFMHRAIGGYPRPIKPADTTTLRVITLPAAEPESPSKP